MKYKDTDIQWLGKIPKHWETTTIKNHFYVIPSNVDKKTKENEIPVELCNYVDVYYNDFIDLSVPFMEATANENEVVKFQLKEKDVLITKDSEDPLDIGVPALINEVKDKLLCGYHLSMLRSKSNKITGDYLFWLLRDTSIASQLWREATGVTRWAIASRHVKNSIIALPPKKEQIAIADYLDKACKRINKIIKIKEEQLKTLSNYFISYRHKVITQGIDKKIFVSYDDDFLKKVPSDWKLTKLRYLLSLKNGKLIKNSELVKNGDFPVYGGNGIMGRTSNYNYKDDLIIIGRVGAKCGNVHYTNEKIWVSDNAIAVKSLMDYEYTLNLLKVLKLNRLASETAQPLLVGNNVKKLYVAIPKKNEQIEIVKRINFVNQKIEQLKIKTKSQLTILKDYRENLIHECVTGKKQIIKTVETVKN